MVSITITSDNVYYQWKDTTEWCLAGSAGITIDEGDKISTDDTGNATGTLDDGEVININPLTTVIVYHSNSNYYKNRSLFQIIWDILGLPGSGGGPSYYGTCSGVQG